MSEAKEKLNKIFKENIKFSFVSKECVTIVTKNDKCYQFRRDHFINKIKNSLIALSDNELKIKSLIEESFVQEFSHKNVINIKSNEYNTIACSSDGNIYLRWVKRLLPKDSDEIESSSKQFLMNKNIAEMCCIEEYIIVLTCTGDVYSLGSKVNPRIYNDIRDLGNYHSTPNKFNAFNGEKVKGISCGAYHLMALTETGRVYGWGCNDCGQLGIGNGENSDSPKLVKLSEILTIEKISCGNKHSLFLSLDGDIYVCGLNKRGELGTGNQNDIFTPRKLSHSEKFVDIASHCDHSICAAISLNSVYFIWGLCGEEVLTEPKETEFKTFDDIFEHYCQKTCKPVEGNIIRFNDDIIVNGKYVQNFIEKRKMGEGNYGEVFEVGEKNKESMIYAIKMINLTVDYKNEFLIELGTSPRISELKHENIVKYHDVWLENDFIIKNGLKSYIQMELCDISLNEIINEIKAVSNFDSNRTLTPLGYYIASEIFIEILEGVNYLHKQNPPIIHRDLNPFNILLKTEKQSHRVVKIADFGLSTIHEYVNQSHSGDRGNLEYLAPEVELSTKYDTRADIYSLGIVLRELFVIDVNRNYKMQNECHSESVLMNKYIEIKNIYDRMTRESADQRPHNIEEILGKNHLWALNLNEFDSGEECEKVFESFTNNESFIIKLLETRLFLFWEKYHANLTSLEKIEPCDDIFQSGKYNDEFYEKRKIGEGNNGEVFEVGEEDGPSKYAIKTIELKIQNEKDFIKRMKIYFKTSELWNKYIVKNYDIWLENDFKLLNGRYIHYFTLYILMELCHKSLDEMIIEIKNDPNLYSSGTLTPLGYYIASEIFIEILEGVNFLHKQNPPIVHSDLKPKNIMLKINKQSPHFVKIADKDMIPLHKLILQSIPCIGFSEQFHTMKKGTLQYKAPEVEKLNLFDDTTQYGTETDIYSVGVIFKELLHIDIYRYYLNIENQPSLVNYKYEAAKNLCIEMVSHETYERPNCEEVLEYKHLWAFTVEQFDTQLITNYSEKLNNSNENNESFVVKLLEKIFLLFNNLILSDASVSDESESNSDVSDSYESDSYESDSDESDGDESDGNESDGNEKDGNEKDGDEGDSNASDGNESDANESDGDESDGDESDESDESDETFVKSNRIWPHNSRNRLLKEYNLL